MKSVSIAMTMLVAASMASAAGISTTDCAVSIDGQFRQFDGSN